MSTEKKSDKAGLPSLMISFAVLYIFNELLKEWLVGFDWIDYYMRHLLIFFSNTAGILLIGVIIHWKVEWFIRIITILACVVFAVVGIGPEFLMTKSIVPPLIAVFWVFCIFYFFNFRILEYYRPLKDSEFKIPVLFFFIGLSLILVQLSYQLVWVFCSNELVLYLINFAELYIKIIAFFMLLWGSVASMANRLIVFLEAMRFPPKP